LDPSVWFTPIHILRQAGTQTKKAIELFEHSGCGDCDIRLWANLLTPLQPIPHFLAHLQDGKPAPSCKLFKFPILYAVPEQV
jgi:hypothetical protein